MTTFYWALTTALVVVLLGVLVQEVRYLRIRRDAAADRQALFHSSSAFHVVTVVELSKEQDLLVGVRGLANGTESSGGKVVYAGKVAVNALHSSQVPDAEWDAFLLAEYSSRDAYEAAKSNPELQKARASFTTSYAMGMQRSPWINLAIPIGFLGMRVVDTVKQTPSRIPFAPHRDADPSRAEAAERRDRVIGGLLANRDYGKDAVVVLNFLKDGSAEERKANASYGSSMISLMAETGSGPMHLGAAVTLEGDAEFDNVAIVYYPGVEFFASMLQSEFFGSIAGDKQLGDTLSSPTVPLLPHL